MTNAQIIFNKSIELMNNGKIGTTGRTLQIRTASNEIQEILEPEPIHTYAAWKQLGYQVKKGSKAVAQFSVWKHVSKKEDVEVTYTDGTKGTEEIDNSKMFMKLASFFTISQVEK